MRLWFEWAMKGKQIQQATWLAVDTPAKATAAAEDIGSSKVIGIDTEYDSLRYFREKLCLLQVKAEKSTYIFDPLGNLDIAFLGEYFASPVLCKVMHAGDNDIRILKRDYDFVFQNIFDTYRAASLLGCDRLSLVNVVREYLSVEFEKQKSMQRSRWDLRPLKEEQLHYAALDTAYLPELYLRLQDELEKAGLAEEAVRIFADMTKVRWQKRELDKEGYKKISRYYALTDIQKERLKRLFRWRYGKAKESNRAAFMILSDQDLVHLSEVEAGSITELLASGFLPGGKLQHYGAELMELLGGCPAGTEPR